MANITKTFEAGMPELEVIYCGYSTGNTYTYSYTLTRDYNVAYAVFMSLSAVNRGGGIASVTAGDATIYNGSFSNPGYDTGNANPAASVPTIVNRYDNPKAGKVISGTAQSAAANRSSSGSAGMCLVIFAG